MAFRLASAWRKIGGLAVAALLAVMVLSPVVDAVVCNDERATASETLDERSTLAALDQIGHAPDQPGGGLEACPHGHCHHGAAFTVADIAQPVSVSPAPAGHALAHAALPPSAGTSGLDRPPRA